MNARVSSGSSRWAGLTMAVCLIGGPIFAAPSALAESLPEALGSAYAYNPRLDAQRAFLRARDEDVPIAMSGYRPEVFVGGDY
ncbi:MAG: channel protein TolC, partial [Hyphomicrobium sp.]